MSEQVEPKIVVEWDPERYEESMAAIQAWCPEGVAVELKGRRLVIFSASGTFNYNASLYTLYTNGHGLTIYVNSQPFLQVVRANEYVNKEMERIICVNLTQDSFTLSEDDLSNSIKDLFILSSSIEKVLIENLRGLNRLTIHNSKIQNLELIDLFSLNHLETYDDSNKFWKKGYNQSKIDKIFIKNSNDLTELRLSHSPTLKELKLINLEKLKDVNLNSVHNLEHFKCFGANNLRHINLRNTHNIMTFDIQGSDSLEVVIWGSIITGQDDITSQDDEPCRLIDLSFLYNQKKLRVLELPNCIHINNIDSLSNCTNLVRLVLYNCELLTNLEPLKKLLNLRELNLDQCGEIHSLDPLFNLPNLKWLTWITKSKTSEVLLNSAILRSDKDFIKENVKEWLKYFSLSKETESFFRRLCAGLDLLADAELFAELAKRSRVFNSEQLDLQAWRYWASCILKLDEAGQRLCFSTALAELESVDHLEGRGAGVIGQMGRLATSKPSWTLELVETQLNLTLEDDDKRRTIAPAAASFYAQWGDHEQVKLWIAHGTHPEAPHWKDQVLLALVEVAMQAQKWTELNHYLSLIETTEQRDQAHVQIGESLMDTEPVRVALDHLKHIVDKDLKQAFALKLGEQAQIYQDPAAMSHLLLALQSQPELLARVLTRLIKEQAESAQILKSLLLQEDEYLAKLHLLHPEALAQLKLVFGGEAVTSGQSFDQAHPVITALKEADLNTLVMDPMNAVQLLVQLKAQYT